MYSLDTNVFMDWQSRFYPLDLFIQLGNDIEALILRGEWRAVDLVREEIDAVGTPGLRAWAHAHPIVFVPLSPEIQVEAAALRRRIRS